MRYRILTIILMLLAFILTGTVYAGPSRDRDNEWVVSEQSEADFSTNDPMEMIDYWGELGEETEEMREVFGDAPSELADYFLEYHIGVLEEGITEEYVFELPASDWLVGLYCGEGISDVDMYAWASDADGEDDWLDYSDDVDPKPAVEFTLDESDMITVTFDGVDFDKNVESVNYFVALVRDPDF